MTPEQIKFKEDLKAVCEMSGLGMCPGCGLTPEGLDDIHQATVEEIIEIIETLNIEGVNRFDGDKTQNVRDYLNEWLMPEIKRNLIKAIKK